MALPEMVCPNCKAVLDLGYRQEMFDILKASWVTCQNCEAEVFIQDNQPVKVKLPNA